MKARYDCECGWSIRSAPDSGIECHECGSFYMTWTNYAEWFEAHGHELDPKDDPPKPSNRERAMARRRKR